MEVCLVLLPAPPSFQKARCRLKNKTPTAFIASDLHLSAVTILAKRAKLHNNTNKKGAAKKAAPFINYEEENLFIYESTFSK